MNAYYAHRAGEIAREAGQFLKHFSDDHKLHVEHKGNDIDFITNADRESQALIFSRLREAFPNHRFIGEEDNVPDAQIQRMIEAGGDDYFWVCDPLDGTINYVYHLPLYATSIGLVHRGQCVAGAIYLPETDELFTGAQGCGAFLNGQPIHTSACESLHFAITAVDLPILDMAMRERFLNWTRDVAMASANLRITGSACLGIALVACGRLDAYWNQGLHAWDVAAGIAITEAAGGAVTDLYGQPFHFDMERGFMVTTPGLRGAFGDIIRE